MRVVRRKSLPPSTQAALAQRQASLLALPGLTAKGVEKDWKAARQTKPLKTVHAVLTSMAGECQRCMYCSDSHGTDIEHFHPKGLYFHLVYVWENMLLCCTECGRLKGTRFNLDEAGVPLLLNPTTNNPWDHVDFDPLTGLLSARYTTGSDVPSPLGRETVEALKLDEREALAKVYKKNYLRLLKYFDERDMQATAAAKFMDGLLAEDDCGLVGWIFLGTGSLVAPLSDIRARAGGRWDECVEIYRGSVGL